MDVKWVKIVTDIFDDEKILLIESMPDADSIIVVWFKLLCLAGKQNNNGVFLMNHKIPYTEKMLSTIFRRKETTVQLALKTFEEFGMIEIIDHTITIPKWEKYQNIDGLEKLQEKARLRQQKYREKQKFILANNGDVTCDVTSDVSVTVCNAVEKEKEKEKEKDNKIYKTKFEKNLVESFSKNIDLQTCIFDFIKMRKTMKSPLTERGLKGILNKLQTECESYPINTQEKIMIALLEQSIINNWKSIYPLNQESVMQMDTKSNANTKKTKEDEEKPFRERPRSDFGTEEEYMKYLFDNRIF